MCLMAFYFAYATLLFVQPVHKSMIAVYFITLACFSLSYFFRFNDKYSKLKFLPALGAIVAILYLRTITGAIAIIFPFVYMIFFVKRDEYYVDYNTFKELFSKLIIAIIALMVVLFIIGLFELFRSVSLQYVIVFIISGLYLLRTTRHSIDVITNKVFSIMNITIIIITCIICLVLSSEIAVNTIIYMIKLIYDKVIVSIVLGIVYTFATIAMLIMKLISLFVDPNDNEAIMEDIGEIPKVLEEGQSYESNFLNNDTYFFILNIIAYTLIIILCIYLLKKYLSKRNRQLNEEVEGIRQYRSFLEDKVNLNKKNKQIFKNSINQIRHWYRKFLELCHKKNMDICIYDNSQSIYEKSCDVFVNSKEELESIKEIYRKARYSKDDIDGRDIKRIKSIYKKLENEKNSKDK